MERATAQAELDSVRSQKPDTSEADGLREELAKLRDTHQASLKTLKEKSESQLNALRTELESNLQNARAELQSTQSDLALAQKDLEAHNLQAEAKVKTAKADYEDLHHTMTELVETEQKKVAELEEKLVAEQKQTAENLKKLEELDAQLKVKDAEIVEAKVCPNT
jgi:ElaB/YqjD/DUF883 family membrane-anchored ribosome-binding protein